MGVRKGNNVGLVTTTLVATGNLCHALPTVNPTTALIRKVMWYNNTGVAETIILGTWDNTLPASLFVPLFPTINCVNGMDGELTEEELPEVEFAVDGRAGALGMTGDIYVLASAAGILVRLEVEEFREGR